MLDTMQRSTSALDAVCLLSSLHRHALNTGDPKGDPQAVQLFSRVRSGLIGKANLTEGDAMAGLHVVSWVLFCGGRGQWQEFLHIACRFSSSILYHPDHHSPQDALMKCNETTRFIIKTSMWFDVLAAATRVEVPYFLDIYRSLFNPNAAYIDHAPSSVPPELDMLPVMGAENHVVWALAEISNLACWKDLQKRKGALSIPELVRRGQAIESYLKPPAVPRQTYSDMDENRMLTSEVFRASARVYLHSVLSGDYPSCNEIIDGVEDTIRCLQRVPPRGNRTVIRSVVFGICICGCLTDIPWQREFLLERLEAQRKESVGNCAEVKELIHRVWANRAASDFDSFTWRDVMRESQMLLV